MERYGGFLTFSRRSRSLSSCVCRNCALSWASSACCCRHWIFLFTASKDFTDISNPSYNPLSDLQTPTETESGWKSEFLNKPRAQIWSASVRLKTVANFPFARRWFAEPQNEEFWKKRQECQKKVQSQEEDAGFGWHQGVVFLFDYVLTSGHIWCFLWMTTCDCIIIEIWMRKILNAQKKRLPFTPV